MYNHIISWAWLQHQHASEIAALVAVGFSIAFTVILLDPPCYSVVQIEPKSFQAVKSGQSSPDLQQRQSRYASYAVTRKQSFKSKI